MYIHKPSDEYLISTNDSLKIAIEKLTINKSRIVFVQDKSKKIVGTITDGDIRNLILKSESLDTAIVSKTFMNQNFFYASTSTSKDAIRSLLESKHNVIPILSTDNKITAIAKKTSENVKIGKEEIGPKSKCFIIAEIGNNHNGNLANAKKLVDLAIESGASCVKFQHRDLAELYNHTGNLNDKETASEDLGSQYTIDLLKRFSLSKKNMLEIFAYCKEKGILAICTPWDIKSLKDLESINIPAYKIASADLVNHELINEVIKTRKPNNSINRHVY